MGRHAQKGQIQATSSSQHHFLHPDTPKPPHSQHRYRSTKTTIRYRRVGACPACLPSPMQSQRSTSRSRAERFNADFDSVLKRAHELMGVGQQQAALVLLHEHITSKRSRNVPIASLEPVMLLLVEQSVEQKKGKLAKDALYQYKNISQNTNVGTIEVSYKTSPSVSCESTLTHWYSWFSRSSSSWQRRK
jgi:hypothetical protein